MPLASLLAIFAILAQLGIIWAVRRFVKGFGALTEAQLHLANAILVAHQSNLKVHEHNLKIFEELKALTAKGAAA